jgi:hypothetical protein
MEGHLGLDWQQNIDKVNASKPRHLPRPKAEKKEVIAYQLHEIGLEILAGSHCPKNGVCTWYRYRHRDETYSYDWGE